MSRKGPGTVKSSPGGVNCGNVCGRGFKSGSTVTLSAKPDKGAVFSLWGGACAGTATDTACLLDMTAPQHVSAVFARVATATAQAS